MPSPCQTRGSCSHESPEASKYSYKACLGQPAQAIYYLGTWISWTCGDVLQERPLCKQFFGERSGLHTPISPYITHVPLYTLLHSYRTLCNLTQANESCLVPAGPVQAPCSKRAKKPTRPLSNVGVCPTM